eukprot:GILJ01010349.1.p1 GENE.GILJ01010349.1~~GILJ01010349.1.p1  ORF type:complete len:1398 (-),score=342.82 GILJ01010349.1:162-4355(-)
MSRNTSPTASLTNLLSPVKVPPVRLPADEDYDNGVITSYTDRTQLRGMIMQKEKELHDINDLRFNTLEALMRDKDKSITELRIKLNKLKEDFQYNLKLLEERDQELEKYDQSFISFKGLLKDKENEVSELRVDLSNMDSKMKQEAMRFKDEVDGLSQRIEDLNQQLSHCKWTKEEDLRRQREELEMVKRDLLKQLRDKEEQIEDQRRELTSAFDDAIRQRETESMKREEALKEVLNDRDVKVKSLLRDVEAKENKIKELFASIDALSQTQKEVERKLKTAANEYESLQMDKTQKLNAAEEDKRQLLLSQRALVDEYELKMSDMLKNIHQLEMTLVQQKDKYEENLRNLTTQNDYKVSELTTRSEKRIAQLQSEVESTQRELKEAKAQAKREKDKSLQTEKELRDQISEMEGKLKKEVANLKNQVKQQQVQFEQTLEEEKMKSKAAADKELNEVEAKYEKLLSDEREKGNDEYDKFSKNTQNLLEEVAALKKDLRQQEADHQHAMEDERVQRKKEYEAELRLVQKRYETALEEERSKHKSDAEKLTRSYEEAIEEWKTRSEEYHLHSSSLERELQRTSSQLTSIQDELDQTVKREKDVTQQSKRTELKLQHSEKNLMGLAGELDKAKQNLRDLKLKMELVSESTKIVESIGDLGLSRSGSMRTGFLGSTLRDRPNGFLASADYGNLSPRSRSPSRLNRSSELNRSGSPKRNLTFRDVLAGEADQLESDMNLTNQFKSRIAQLEDERAVMSIKNQDLELQIARLKTVVSDMRLEMNSIQTTAISSVTDPTGTVNQLMKERAHLCEQLQSMYENNDILSRKMEELINLQRKTSGSFSLSVDVDFDEAVSLRRKAQELNAQVMELQDECLSLRAEIGRLKDRIAALENENRALDGHNSQLEVQTSRLESQSRQFEVEVAKLDKQNRELEHQTRLLENQNRVLENQNRQLEVHTKQQQQQLLHTQTVMKEKTHKLEHIQSEIKLLEEASNILAATSAGSSPSVTPSTVLTGVSSINTHSSSGAVTTPAPLPTTTATSATSAATFATSVPSVLDHNDLTQSFQFGSAFASSLRRLVDTQPSSVSNGIRPSSGSSSTVTLKWEDSSNVHVGAPLLSSTGSASSSRLMEDRVSELLKARERELAEREREIAVLSSKLLDERAELKTVYTEKEKLSHLTSVLKSDLDKALSDSYGSVSQNLFGSPSARVIRESSDLDERRLGDLEHSLRELANQNRALKDEIKKFGSTTHGAASDSFTKSLPSRPTSSLMPFDDQFNVSLRINPYDTNDDLPVRDRSNSMATHLSAGSSLMSSPLLQGTDARQKLAEAKREILFAGQTSPAVKESTVLSASSSSSPLHNGGTDRLTLSELRASARSRVHASQRDDINFARRSVRTYSKSNLHPDLQ